MARKNKGSTIKICFAVLYFGEVFISARPRPVRHGCVSDRNYLSIYTLSFIASGLLYNMIFWHARDSPCRELIFPCHIFCWYCIEHFESGAALPSITNFWILSTSISSIGRGVVPVPVQITTAKVICQWRERELGIRIFRCDFVVRLPGTARVIPTNNNIGPTFIRTVTHLKSPYLGTQSVKDISKTTGEVCKKRACTDVPHKAWNNVIPPA